MEQRLLDLLTRYGAPVLFAAQMFGIFGLPIPDELLLTVAGALVRRGTLGLVPTVAAAVAGCISGITLSYVLGRTVGLVTLRRVLHVPEETLDRAHRWFQRFGGWLLTFGYFIPGVRHVTAIAAGSTPLEYARFAAYAYPGAVLWSAVFVTAGYVAGERWREAASIVRHHAAIVALVLIAVAAVAWMVMRRMSGARRG